MPSYIPGTPVEIVRTLQHCGLCSNMLVTASAAYEVMKAGGVPVINFRDRHYTQLHDSSTAGRLNAWEDYFEQPFGMSLDDISSVRHERYEHVSDLSLDRAGRVEQACIAGLLFRPVGRITNMVASFMSGVDTDRTVGVLLRGTDYRSVHPGGESIQPEIADVVADIKSVAERYGLDTVYLVCDDRSFADTIAESTSMNVILRQRTFIDYTAGRFNGDIMKDLPHGYKLELNSEYLSNVIAMTMLKYNIFSHTSAYRTYRYLRLLKPQPVFQKVYWIGYY